MKRNKPRLVLSLYARPKHPGSYHYAIFVMSKITANDVNKGMPLTATKYHVKNTLQNVDGAISQPWMFEAVTVPDVGQEMRLLACVVVGKIFFLEGVQGVLGTTPVYQVDDPDREEAMSFDCRTWVIDGLERLRRSGAVSGLLDWQTIEEGALNYVKEKKEAGRWDGGGVQASRIPLFDLITRTELIS